jgi:uroporphyrinogen-III synthase
VKLLIIRPQPGADASAARVRAAGFDPLVLPLFAIEPMAWELRDTQGYAALILTSGNAVRAARDALRRMAGLPVYAVGSATAKALSGAGVSATHVGAGGIAELLPEAATNGHHRLLWLAGEEHSDVAPPPGVSLDIRIVYRSAPLPAPLQFNAIVEQSDAVLLHSARAARHFAETCDGSAAKRADIVVAALSQNIADAAGAGWGKLLVAARPDDASLLSEVQSFFTSVSRDPTQA